MIPVNITFCSPTSTEICSANLGHETTFPTLLVSETSVIVWDVVWDIDFDTAAILT